MFESCAQLASELDEVESGLADPAVHADQAQARRLGRRYAALRPIVGAYRDWLSVTSDLETATELADQDESFAAEVLELLPIQAALAEKLTELLLPRDPMDDKDVIVEIKAGEGGDESALFCL